jgi:hypothetical protein
LISKIVILSISSPLPISVKICMPDIVLETPYCLSRYIRWLDAVFKWL